MLFRSLPTSSTTPNRLKTSIPCQRHVDKSYPFFKTILFPKIQPVPLLHCSKLAKLLNQVKSHTLTTKNQLCQFLTISQFHNVLQMLRRISDFYMSWESNNHQLVCKFHVSNHFTIERNTCLVLYFSYPNINFS